MEDALLPIEEIIKIHHKKNYRKSDFTLDDALRTFNYFVSQEGNQIVRLRNSLFLLMPKDKNDNIEIHIVTADPAELFYGLALRVALALVEKRGVKKIVSDISKEKDAKRFKEIFSPAFVKVTKSNHGPQMIIDAEGLYNKYSKGVQR